MLKRSVCADGDNGGDEERRRRLWIADSKTVYKAGQGLHALERGTLAAMANAVRGPRLIPDTCRDVWSAFDPSADDPEALAELRYELSERVLRGEYFGFLEIGPDVVKPPKLVDVMFTEFVIQL